MLSLKNEAQKGVKHVHLGLGINFIGLDYICCVNFVRNN